MTRHFATRRLTLLLLLLTLLVSNMAIAQTNSTSPRFQHSSADQHTPGLDSHDMSFTRLDNNTGLVLNGGIFSADLNGDGKPDVIVNAFNGKDAYETYILFGKGDGTFSPSIEFSSCCIFGIADVNGDGKPDVIVGYVGDLWVYLGNGNGTFQTPRRSPTIAGGPGVFRDVNHDGKVDAILVQQGGGVAVQLGNGDGTFQTAKTFSNGGGQEAGMVAGDFNGDGNIDIAVSNFGTPPNYTDSTVAVLLGNGDGTLGPPTLFPVGAFSGQLVAADFNGDNKLDVAVTNTMSSSVSVLIGRGDGTFEPKIDFPVAYSPFFLSVADFDGDGKVDLAVGGIALSILPGNGDGTFGPKQDFPGVSSFQGNTIADFNLDGRPDLGFTYGGGSPTLSVFLNTTAHGTATATTLVSSLNPSNVGQSVTFTATVTSNSGTPTGTVNFFDGSTSLGSATLSGGSASLSTASLTSGSHSITAAYQGSADFAPSTSPILTQVVNGGISPTTTALTSSAHHQERFKPVTYAATITSQNGGAVTGTVVFQDNGSTIATVTVSGNAAHYTTSYPTSGTHLIVAIYSGDASNAGSTSPTLTQFIGAGKPPFPTETALSIGCCTLVGQPITFTATVSSLYGAIPDGDQVKFFVENRTVGIGTLVGGVTSVTTSSIPAGRHSIQAFYEGDPSFKHSFVIKKYLEQKYSTTTALVSSLNPAVYGQPVTYTVTVTSTGPDIPTGNVKVTEIGLLPLVGGVATITNAKVAVGNHAIKAEYLADPVSEKSTSPVLHQVVTPASTTTTIASSLNPSSLGQTVTFTATVTSSTGIAPFGSVTFAAGSVTLGITAVANGKASISTASLPVGSTTITATYDGGAGFTGSAASLTQTVNP